MSEFMKTKLKFLCFVLLTSAYIYFEIYWMASMTAFTSLVYLAEVYT